MKTEIELEALPLNDRQKHWVELRTTQPGSKDYPTAKALITFIEATDDWEEPAKIEVTAKADCLVDGASIKKGNVAQVYPWQYFALARFLKPVKALAKDAFPNPKPLDPPAPLAKGAAALIALLFLLLGGNSQAQTQTTLQGGPGQFVLYSIAGLNGGTNNIIASTNVYNTNIITSVTNVVPNWIIGANGLPTNQTTTNISYTTNTPGLIALYNWDQAQLMMGFNAGQGTGTNCTFDWDTSADGLNWATNALIFVLAQSGTGYVCSNYYFAVGAVPAYLRLGAVAAPTGFLYASNITAEIALRAKRTGP
jgi:hypothetical protein